MALDLSALDHAEPAANSGQPLSIDIKLIVEDLSQPRTEFKEDKLDELAASIKAFGVLQPILVHSADPKGKHVIVVGARRYRASLRAGLTHIPCIIRDIEKVDLRYAQMAENLQKEGFSPMEMAVFIKQEIDAGIKRKDIADRLVLDPNYISRYLSLLEGPEILREIYASGKCQNVVYLNEIHQLHKKWPNEVEAFCRSDNDITYSTLKQYRDHLNKGKTPSDSYEEAKPVSRTYTPGVMSGKRAPIVGGAPTQQKEFILVLLEDKSLIKSEFPAWGKVRYSEFAAQNETITVFFGDGKKFKLKKAGLVYLHEFEDFPASLIDHEE